MHVTEVARSSSWPVRAGDVSPTCELGDEIVI